MKRAILIISAGICILLLALPLPSPLFKQDFSKFILDHEGKLLDCQVASDEQWRFQPIEEIPEELIRATLLFEDEHFYIHPGINPISLYRAWRQNSRAGYVVSGGSTITMQLVRMALGNPDRTYGQKLWECLLAIKLDLVKSKKSILRHYYSQAPYGGNLVGVRAASFRYFGRDIDQLSKAEYALLAILPNNPGFLFPGNQQDDKLLEKRNRLLKKWADSEEWKEEDLLLSIAEPLPTKLKDFPHRAYHAMHQHHSSCEKTSLDSEMQVKVMQLVENRLANLSGNYIHNAAVLIVDIHTGLTKVYVGNGNPTVSGENRFVDMVHARRSPGSTLKPILYANSIAKRIILPEQILPDHPIHLEGFSPKNFNRKYQGAISADQALASSLNIPFVHLLQNYGYEQFHIDLLQAGFRLPNPPDHYGLSLILGGMEVSMWQLTSAYRQMAYNHLNLQSAPIDRLFANIPQPGISMCDTIRVSKWSGSGWFHPLSVGFMLKAMTRLRRPEDMEHWERYESASQIAWKTGTSYGFRDAWAVGIGGKHIITVWVGNANGVGRPDLIGSKAAAPLLFDIVAAIQEPDCELLEIGEPITTCMETGIKAGALCNDTKMVRLLDSWHDQTTCSHHQIWYRDKESGLRVDPSCFPKGYKADTILDLPPAMSRYMPTSWIHQPAEKWHPACGQESSQQKIELLYPTPGSVIGLVDDQSGRPGEVVFHAVHGDASETIFWYLSEQFLGKTQGVHKLAVHLEPDNYVLTAVDESGQVKEVKFSVIKS